MPFNFVAVGPQAREKVADVLRRDSFVSGLAHTDDGLLLIQELQSFLTEAESAELDAVIAAFMTGDGGMGSA